MLHGNASGVPSPVAETFQNLETAGNAPETFPENEKRFMVTGN
ncbi:hypothetical protein Tco_0661609, partial [Tanacetum coccineum]